MKILIINLKRSIERRQDIEEQLHKLNISNYEFIEAVDGNQLDDSIIDQKIALRILKQMCNRTLPLNMGEAGCMLSHIKAYKRSLELNERCIILEDDCLLTDSFIGEIEQELKDEYELVYFGYALNVKGELGPYISQHDTQTLDKFCDLTSSKIILNKFCKIENTNIIVYGTHAYSPSLSACKKMLKYNTVIAPSDIFLNIINLNRYCAINKLIHPNNLLKSIIGDRSE